MSKKVRVRFAPSPTGYLHIGGLRTALYNYLYAKKTGGTFIVRIEDTDKERFVEGATESLLKTLQMVSLPADEGVYLKNDQVEERGKHGPYIQSQRLDIYKKYAQQLINSGHAYYCFCTTEELDQMRTAQQAAKQLPKYDRRCLKLNPEEVKQKLADNIPYVIRLKIPNEGSTTIHDAVRGDVTFNHVEIDDQVLMKSDGYPTYHLANVVDDHLMDITHVIRGEEWLPSTPKHILLYQALKWDIPTFAHIPLLLSTNRAKLSKRQGDVAAEEFLNKGYLAQTLINFVALLGWNPGTTQEIFSLDELIKAFSLEQINKAGAVVDPARLDWFNAHYIRTIVQNRQKNSDEYKQLLDQALTFLEPLNSSLVNPLTHSQLELSFLMQAERINKLSDLPELNKFLFELESYDPQLIVFKKSDAQKTKQGLLAANDKLNEVEEWSQPTIKKALEDAQAAANLNPGDLFWPVRVALTGRQSSPPPEMVAEVLGKEATIKRLEQGIAKLL